MERTRNDSEEVETIGYEPQEEPIMIPKATMDLLLKQDKPAQLIALYTFYYYTAKWQHTNQPKATASYVAKGLKWDESTVKKYRTQLVNLGLIDTVRKRDDNGTFIQCYTKINFIWSKAKTKDSIHKVENPPGGSNHQWKNPPTNALSSNSINALSSNNKEKVTKVTLVSGGNHPESVAEILDVWGKLSNGRKHKTGTKVFSRITTQIDRLLEGKPLLCTKDDKPTKPLLNFIEKHSIRSQLLFKQWTTQEIIQVLQTIHDQHLKEPTALDTVLWNQFSGRNRSFSWFLFVADQQFISEKYISLARKLADTINPDLDKARLIDWSKEFEDMIIHGGVNIGVLSEVLDWYDEHISDKYTPQAFHILEFRDKYDRILNAMKRSEKDSRTDVCGTPENLMY